MRSKTLEMFVGKEKFSQLQQAIELDRIFQNHSFLESLQAQATQLEESFKTSNRRRTKGATGGGETIIQDTRAKMFAKLFDLRNASFTAWYAGYGCTGELQYFIVYPTLKPGSNIESVKCYPFLWYKYSEDTIDPPEGAPSNLFTLSDSPAIIMRNSLQVIKTGCYYGKQKVSAETIWENEIPTRFSCSKLPLSKTWKFHHKIILPSEKYKCLDLQEPSTGTKYSIYATVQYQSVNDDGSCEGTDVTTAKPRTVPSPPPPVPR